jgi:hypothetical protein
VASHAWQHQSGQLPALWVSCTFCRPVHATRRHPICIPSDSHVLVEVILQWDLHQPSPVEARVHAAGAQQPVQGEVRVDTMLVNWLRPHQREGVAFMFDCVMGLRLEAGRGT